MHCLLPPVLARSYECCGNELGRSLAGGRETFVLSLSLCVCLCVCVCVCVCGVKMYLATRLLKQLHFKN